jgi:hypothetical protein
MEAKLPPLFATLDTRLSDFPSRYNIFITCETSSSVQEVYTMKPTASYIEEVLNEYYRPTLNNTLYTYNNDTTACQAQFWKTGMAIYSSTEYIPVYEFELDVFSKDATYPVYPPCTLVTHCARLRILREQRNALLYGHPYISIPPTLLVNTEFRLPRHAAQAIVRSLILDKQQCCITTNSFDTISTIGITPCYHCFDYNALKEWLSVNSTCAECRASVKSIAHYRV